MCTSRPRQDDTVQRQMEADAAEARRREEERAARLRAGTEAVNRQFAQFDDGFFNAKRDAYLDYNLPQLDDQYSDARKALTFSLARAGLLRSSVAGEQQGKLRRTYDTNRAVVVNQAANEADQLRNEVENQRGTILDQLSATADDARATNDALARSRNLSTRTPTVSVLPDVFANATAGIGGYRAGQQYGQVASMFGPRASNPRGAGSSRVVGG